VDADAEAGGFPADGSVLPVDKGYIHETELNGISSDVGAIPAAGPTTKVAAVDTRPKLRVGDAPPTHASANHASLLIAPPITPPIAPILLAFGGAAPTAGSPPPTRAKV
jgi:hypothetical protein